MKPRKLFESSAGCPRCNAFEVVTFRYADTLDFRNLELAVDDLERSRCSSCEYEWETAEQTERNHARIREEYSRQRDLIRARDGLLTGAEIQEMRETLGITQKEAAVLFGGGPNSFNKYESGEVLQSYAMDRLIRIAGALGKGSVLFLRDVRNPSSLQPQAEHSYVVVWGKAHAPSSKANARGRSELSAQHHVHASNLRNYVPSQRRGSSVTLDRVEV